MKSNKGVFLASSLISMFSILTFLFVSPGSVSLAQQKSYDPEVVNVYKAIYQVGYKNEAKGIKIAELINQESKRFKIDHKILVALIMIESSFRQDAVSETGDISLAQINVNIWKKEFKRLKRQAIDIKRMHKEQGYAINKMAEILSILAERHKGKVDWAAYYHSSTPEFKTAYYKKVRKQLRKMEVQPIKIKTTLANNLDF